MFSELRQKIEDAGETTQVIVDSDKLVPNISVNNNGDRVFSLFYDGEEYPCLQRGWISWAQKVLAPDGDDTRKRHDLVDEVTGRRKRWSTATVRHFLNMTPVGLANEIVHSWWSRYNRTPWSVVKYIDGPIRFIGTNRYKLYRHEEFLEDISKTSFAGMRMQYCALNEDRMVIRITSKDPLKELGNNVFAGYHLMNSENGSSAIVISHMIYDLLCTNGLMNVFEEKHIVSQKHIGFDTDEFRDRVEDISLTMDELHEKTLELVKKLVTFSLDSKEVDAILKMYEKRYDASKRFISMVKESPIRNMWELVSAITNTCQKYSWAIRLEHESNAGKLLRDVLARKHLKYAQQD